jgi:hypothetical protein
VNSAKFQGTGNDHVNVRDIDLRVQETEQAANSIDAQACDNWVIQKEQPLAPIELQKWNDNHFSHERIPW